jgi:hypothetical protein
MLLNFQKDTELTLTFVSVSTLYDIRIFLEISQSQLLVNMYALCVTKKLGGYFNFNIIFFIFDVHFIDVILHSNIFEEFFLNRIFLVICLC